VKVSHAVLVVVCICSAFTLLIIQYSQAQNRPRLSIGQDNFVFERLDDFRGYGSGAEKRTDRELEIVTVINKALTQRNIQLVLVFVPSVMRIYSDRLPSDFQLSETLNGLYSHSFHKLWADKVFVPDLNQAFLNTKKSAGNEFPLFMRQDNHWSSTGAFLAAQTVAEAINNSLRGRLESIKELNSTYQWQAPVVYEGNYYRNLTAADKAKVVQDRLRPIVFTRETGGDLLGNEMPRIALTGSSFSHQKEFGFVDALAHFLRRDILNASKSGKSFWDPMRDYLTSDAFQQKPPTMLLWEIPEDHLAPGYPPVDWAGPEARRQFLLDVGANIPSDCGTAGLKPKGISGVDVVGSLNSATLSSKGSNSLVRFEFNQPIRADQYLSVRVNATKADSLTSLTIEGQGQNPQKILVKLETLATPHQINVPLATLSGENNNRLSLRATVGSDLQLDSAKLCSIPGEFMAVLNQKK
jgi:alginate O-acetyltransferase complex protein AlgJ